MRNKKSSEKKTLGPHDYTVEPYQTFKELTLILLKIFQNKKKTRGRNTLILIQQGQPYPEGKTRKGQH